MQPSIADALASLARRSNPARTIYVCHAPPADTDLDALPRGRHGGSRALRAFIERYAPPLTLHGHVHEAPMISHRYAIRLGSTWCLNPGHDGRRFHGIVIDLGDTDLRFEHTVYGAAGSLAANRA
jgi:Icc-related predicted phosphoesterase